MRQALIVLTVALGLWGCSTRFYETHYFRSEPRGASAPNYFRLTVQGSTALSSTRYLSGYFDEETVDVYFNEFTQPKRGAIRPALVSSAADGLAAAEAAPNTQPVARGLRDKKLVLILSSNSDDVANQIGALAASREFTASLAGLVARDQYTLADDEERRLTLDRQRAKTTADLAQQFLDTLPANASAAEVERQLLALINALAADLSHESPFPTLDSASQWLEFNRARLLRGDR